MAVSPVLPLPTRRQRLQRDVNIGATAGASAPAVYASRVVLPPPMQDSLPAGWLTFAARESNPLDRDERFPSPASSSPFPGFILTLPALDPRQPFPPVPVARKADVVRCSSEGARSDERGELSLRQPRLAQAVEQVLGILAALEEGDPPLRAVDGVLRVDPQDLGRLRTGLVESPQLREIGGQPNVALAHV